VSIASLKPRIAQLDMRQGSGIAVERIRGYELTKIRARILLRDGYTCRVCGRSSSDLVVDHVQPLHLGGAESDENRQAICPEPCHRLKSELEERERL
jgi:5-methylcytosine-specific restriction endonuclease McrA